MKTLGKLKIIIEKLINEDDLVALKGGYGGACCWCVDGNEHIIGSMAASNPEQCHLYCSTIDGWHGW
ncbi:MAG: hypothetical protein RBT35_08485 [Bacteroidales bacterium]|jgi:hypothetical protein|nr:hypothetical protein [Bacteroidales bacterium]